MKIGYLHLGYPERGVCRYGLLLAAEARQHSELAVIEVHLTLGEDRRQNREAIAAAARQLSSADVVHVQYSLGNNSALWGSGWEQIFRFRLFARWCNSPIAVTLHDINLTLAEKASFRELVRGLFGGDRDRKSTPSGNLIKRLKQRLGSPLLKFYGARINLFGLQLLSKRVQLILVCTQTEADRLGRLCDRFLECKKLQVIPHFVEERKALPIREDARQALDLPQQQKVITLLGYIHRRKGHQLLVEAMQQLSEYTVIFAGRPSAHPASEKFLQQVVSLAKLEGVADRLRVTGYLSEQELELYLAATDIAVCPFREFSASGSLSTWISTARPILAFELPQIAEYNRLVPGAIQTFAPYTPEALARAIKNCSSERFQGVDLQVSQLQKKLRKSLILEQHLQFYRRVASSRSRCAVSQTSAQTESSS